MRQDVTCIECATVFTPSNPVGRLPIRCPPCAREQERIVNREKHYRWRRRYPEKAREVQARSYAKRAADPSYLQKKRENEARRLYGIEPEDLERLNASQGGVCAVCHGERNGPGTRLHVDHCHKTGRVRGLLCAKCNTMLGLACEDFAILESAIAYLKKT